MSQHSHQLQPQQLKVITVPAFNDNYLWLFHLPGDNRAYAVDPGAAAPIEAALQANNLTLAGILITHHHADHTGGIDALTTGRDIPVYGPAGGSVPQVTRPLVDGDRVEFGDQLSFEIMAVPGHTLDHIAYFSAHQGVVFGGDTLFAGGCGRLFEGTAQQMHLSLDRFAKLPANTLVYCAHEYTLANLKFAQAVEPHNSALAARALAAQALREQKIPTVPSTIALELATNPFMRCHIAAVKMAAETFAQTPLADIAQVFAAVRRWKDGF